jgi:hypothetical protein
MLVRQFGDESAHKGAPTSSSTNSNSIRKHAWCASFNLDIVSESNILFEACGRTLSKIYKHDKKDKLEDLEEAHHMAMPELQ